MRALRRVVITGLGAVAPNGIGKDAFWTNLLAGVSGIDWITAFDASPFPSQIGGEVRQFVPRDFISRRRLKISNMSRSSQLAVAATRLAVEDSKVELDFRFSRAAVFFGSSGGGDVYGAAVNDLRLRGFAAVSPLAALDYPPHSPACYAALELGTRGRTTSIASNCCTGLDVIQSAAAEISSGRTDIAIAGSAEAPLFPTPFATFCALGTVSKRNDMPKKASRPFDRLRDGLVVAEGAGALILEEEDRARDRGATVYAVIEGYAAGNESIDMRKGDLAGEVMGHTIRKAVAAASLRSDEIDHINANGSSLPDFDVADTNAFKLALGNHAYAVPVTSIKSMIGQPFSAAGILQVTAASLAIHHKTVPPTINQEHRDDRCDLDYVPNTSRTARIRHAIVNAHAFGGGCAALVIGDPGL